MREVDVCEVCGCPIPCGCEAPSPMTRGALLDEILRLRAALHAAEAERDRLAEALQRIDEVLTTVEGDNVPRGDGPPLLARTVARMALATGTEDKE
jgi:hypothetical protein